MLIDNKRLSNLLKCIIDYYIEHAAPISSNELISYYKLDLSSATVRNEMVKLEELGYITKHHFASGRIPTTKGYRYYVEHLMGDSDITNIKNELNRLFYDRMLSIDEIINRACEIISDITNVATLHENSPNNKKRLNKIDLLVLDDNSAVILLATSDNSIYNKVINFPNKEKIDELKSCIKYINKRITEISLHDIKTNINFLKPIITKEVQEYEQLLEEIIKSLVNSNKQYANIYGVANIIKNPEFTDYNKIKSILEIMKSSSIWDHLNNLEVIKKDKNSQSFEILLGESIHNEQCKDLAIISTSVLHSNDTNNSKITVIGPKRMDYNKITSLLAWLVEKLDEVKTNRKDVNEGK